MAIRMLGEDRMSLTLCILLYRYLFEGGSFLSEIFWGVRHDS